MAALPDGVRFAVVRAVDLDASRRRLDYLLADGSRRSTIIGRVFDGPEFRDAVGLAMYWTAGLATDSERADRG